VGRNATVKEDAVISVISVGSSGACVTCVTAKPTPEPSMERALSVMMVSQWSHNGLTMVLQLNLDLLDSCQTYRVPRVFPRATQKLETDHSTKTSDPQASGFDSSRRLNCLHSPENLQNPVKGRLL